MTKALRVPTMFEWHLPDIFGFLNLQQKTQILFVCRENICRSPMAEGLLKFHLRPFDWAASVEVRSAGTLVTQPGARPDQRAQRASGFAGIDISRGRASRVTELDLERCDLILAMDESNIEDLMEICPVRHQHKISLLLSFLPDAELIEVPDPYYGSTEGFEKVFELIDAAVRNLVAHLSQQRA